MGGLLRDRARRLWNIGVEAMQKKEKEMRIFVLCLFATYLGTAALATGL